MDQENRKAGKNLRDSKITEEIIVCAIGRSYLKATNLEDGLLFNFATTPLTIKRFCRERASADPSVDLFG
jgi:hypothetical protein